MIIYYYIFNSKIHNYIMTFINMYPYMLNEYIYFYCFLYKFVLGSYLHTCLNNNQSFIILNVEDKRISY